MSVIVLSLSLACVAERLARVAAADDVHRLDLREVERRHVAVPLRVGPVSREHVPARRVILDLPCGRGAEVALDGEVEAADA